MSVIWSVVFIVSLVLLVKASDYFTKYSEHIALAFSISPFIIGVTLIGVGTSLPEFATGIVANLRGDYTIAVATVLGSNIANILLILGLTAVVVKVLKAERDLIDIDLPLLFLGSALLLLIVFDRMVSGKEGVILVIGYVVYIIYAIRSHPITKDGIPEISKKPFVRPKVRLSHILVIIASIAVVYVSAEFTVRSAIALAAIMGIATSTISITAIAVGTSLPELVISLRAAIKGKHDIAIGNIVGSNIFNALMIVGIPSLLHPLVLDETSWVIGVPFFIIATLTFIFSGITKQIYRWEGAMFLLMYALFIMRIFHIV